MSFSSRRRIARVKRSVVAIVIIGAMGFPLSPSQAEVSGVHARLLLESTLDLLRGAIGPNATKGLGVKPQSVATPSQRALDVQYIQLCPRKISLYEEEAFTLVPLPLDSSRQTVHGAAMIWTSNNENVATVTSCGDVSAKGPGEAVVTVQIGTKQASVAVTIQSGIRPRISDQEWDSVHAHDCDFPESAELNEPYPQRPADRDLKVTKGSRFRQANAQQAQEDDGAKDPDNIRAVKFDSTVSGLSHSSPAVETTRGVVSRADRVKYSVRPTLAFTASSSRDKGKSGLRLTSAFRIPSNSGAGVFFQGENPDIYFSQATAINNVVGSPRFSPVEEVQVNSIKTKNNLGSSNYRFIAPALGLGGRGIDVNVKLSCNAQLWGKESGNPTKMIFDYNKLGPAPGWSAGYGRLIPNYDNTLTGDGSSVGQSNAPGNYLWIGPDGTRVQLTQQYDPVAQKWNHTSADGLFTSFNPRSQNLRYSDGTFVTYFSVNNRLLPIKIRNTNGDQITIDYRQYSSSTFPNRFAINKITDSLGRIVQFYYYGDAQYPSGPLAKLAAITAPDQGSSTRTMIRIEYQTVTLQYDFQSAYVIDGPANNTPLTVVSRVYYPATGRGYLFLDYSSYGMCRYISARKDMTGPSGIVDGTEIAYTKYNFVDISTQVGHLNDSPQYTERREWWQGKVDSPAASLYTYQRTKDGSTDTTTVTEPLTNLQTVTTSTDGQVALVQYKNGTTVMGSVVYFYDVFNPSQLITSSTTDEAGNTASVTYDYGSYGRVTNIYESDFSGSTIRRTRYQYSDAQGYIDLNMLHVVTQVAVFDGQTGPMKARTNFTYDDYAIKGGMESYGLTTNTYPPNHVSSFDQNYTTRGNVTGMETYSSLSPNVATIRYSKYDVFGHAIEADVSCCKVKTTTFGWNTFFSQPDATTDGKPGVVPYLTTSFQYDFNTGLGSQTTDPNGQISYISYDSAWRQLTVATPSGAVTTTKFDKDANQNDQLAYSQQVTYSDNGVTKTITNKTWFDGAGRALRAGNGAGASPSSFDTIATQYDSIGRPLKQSNPYTGDSSGNGSPSFWTTNIYDALSRVKEVDLPDDQPAGQRSRILTTYNGPVVAVTDQVGRTHQSQVDGLGRVISITEPDPATGALSLTTTYTYDVLDNLTQTNQGGQIRIFAYDALSRMTSQTSPEGGPVSITYKDFGAVSKRTDARNVETHFMYDSLNRGIQVWYTGPGGSDDPGASRPQLPPGVAATPDVMVSYNTAAPGNGEISLATDAAGTEAYSYDSLGRTTSKTRTVDGNSYQTQYQYNQADQMSLMIYPSGNRVRMNHDSRGRFSGEDKVDAGGSVLTSYASSIGYNVAGQITGLNLGNGVNETYSYSSNRLQLTSQSSTKGASTLTNLSYNYQASAGASGVGTTAGNSGQLMSVPAGSTVNGQPRNETYTYDDLGRLGSAGGYYAQRNYSYDRWGNRTAVSGGSSQTVAIQQPGGVVNNRVANVNGITYVYDSAGNLTNDGVHSYQYDAAGRLATVDGTAATYTYDAANHRVKKLAGAYTTYYVWEGGSVIAEYSNAPAGSGLKYYLADQLSTRVVTDNSGSVIGTQDHLPFGEDSGTSTGQVEKHRFTNYERDGESGTDYAVNRQHSFSIGRFMQPDRMLGSIENPQSLNRYSYTLNDPINLSDPLGLYEGCVHQAMTEFLAKLSGRFSDSVSRQLGQFAGDGPGGADSFRYSAFNNPLNAFLGFLGLGPSATIHFASPEQLGKEKRAFAGFIAQGDPRGIQRAAFVLHSIEDVHGAHLRFELPFGHFFSGNAPDRIIGDKAFIDVSNEVYQFLSGNSSLKLTAKQLNDLINAIIKECGAKKAGQLKIIRPQLPPPITPIITPPETGIFPGPVFGPWYWFISPAPDPPPPPDDGERLA